MDNISSLIDNENNNDIHNEKITIIINFFNSCGINCKTISDLDGMILYRNDLIFSNKYPQIKPFICELKKIISSSIYTSLHNCADKKQRFPLINLIRQLLKSIDYNLTPKRISDGYTRDGIKKYKRIYLIKKNINFISI